MYSTSYHPHCKAMGNSASSARLSQSNPANNGKNANAVNNKNRSYAPARPGRLGGNNANNKTKATNNKKKRKANNGNNNGNNNAGPPTPAAVVAPVSACGACPSMNSMPPPALGCDYGFVRGAPNPNSCNYLPCYVHGDDCLRRAQERFQYQKDLAKYNRRFEGANCTCACNYKYNTACRRGCSSSDLLWDPAVGASPQARFERESLTLARQLAAQRRGLRSHSRYGCFQTVPANGRGAAPAVPLAPPQGHPSEPTAATPTSE